MQIRRSDVAQLCLVGFGLVFLLVVTAVTAAQTQDAINATLFERVASFGVRLDRLETYMTAAIGALAANFLAHLVQIRSQTGRRRSGG